MFTAFLHFDAVHTGGGLHATHVLASPIDGEEIMMTEDIKIHRRLVMMTFETQLIKFSQEGTHVPNVELLGKYSLGEFLSVCNSKRRPVRWIMGR
mmetsp:Transcript_20802/g.49400  ORF Transcript_20802/g.49400 Transcript_20802/m.49400 type:complete len:95 (+) Transcript_20802:856-1140(+)